MRECSGAGAPPSGGGGSAWELARLLGLRTALAPSWATARGLGDLGELGRGRVVVQGGLRGGVGLGQGGPRERGGKGAQAELGGSGGGARGFRVGLLLGLARLLRELGRARRGRPTGPGSVAGPRGGRGCWDGWAKWEKKRNSAQGKRKGVFHF